MQEILDVVNIDDQVIGQNSRDDVHRLGLLHREIRIWIINHKNEILFQKRGPHKTYLPNIFDASVGGHVASGASYEESAIRELFEEVGIIAKVRDLIFMEKVHERGEYPANNVINNVIRTTYIFTIDSNQEFAPEPGEATSLEWWTPERLRALNYEAMSKFVAGITYEAIRALNFVNK